MQGWLLLNKPSGISSFKVLGAIKKIAKPHKVGHAGTLDSFATGMLLVGIGKATRLMSYSIGKDKEYCFTIKFGWDTDTLDIDGNINKQSDVRPTGNQIQKVISEFIGNIEQVPPIYSAVKINGKRACDRARNGEKIQLKSRSVTCYHLSLVEFCGDEAKFHITCSSGFYVRSLAYDIVKKLGACGHVSRLHRSKIGKFTEKEIISLDYIEKIVHNDDRIAFERLLLPIDSVLDDILVLGVSSADAASLQQGKKLYMDNLVCEEDGIRLVKHGELVLGLCDLERGLLSPRKVLI